MTNLPALSKLLVADAVRAALKEDLGRAGDITTQATIPATARAKAVIAAREDGVIAGLALAREAFSQIDAAITFEPCVEDGAHVAKGAVVARIEGFAHGILSAERVALNFLGPTVRRRDANRALCFKNRPHQGEGLRHAQDHAAAARL